MLSTGETALRVVAAHEVDPQPKVAVNRDVGFHVSWHVEADVLVAPGRGEQVASARDVLPMERHGPGAGLFGSISRCSS